MSSQPSPIRLRVGPHGFVAGYPAVGEPGFNNAEADGSSAGEYIMIGSDGGFAVISDEGDGLALLKLNKPSLIVPTTAPTAAPTAPLTAAPICVDKNTEFAAAAADEGNPETTCTQAKVAGYCSHLMVKQNLCCATCSVLSSAGRRRSLQSRFRSSATLMAP